MTQAERKLTCKYCRKSFQAKRFRKCCDRTHATMLVLQKSGRTPWQPEELDLLENLSGSKPLADIARAIQKLDRKMGLPARTLEAVRIQLGKKGLSRKCLYDNFTRQELARTLGVDCYKVEDWTNKYGLPYEKVSRTQGKIALKDLRKWAEQNPHYFAGIDRDRLLFIFDDPAIAQSLSELPPATPSKEQRVRNLSTGQEFPSFCAAARASYVSRSCITEAIARGGTSAGCRWEAIG